MMKNKFEVAANIVVIVLAVVIGSVFLIDRFAKPGSDPNEVKAGDQLPGLAAYKWNAHELTLVLALRNGCHFCEVSMPFYRKLAQLEQSSQIGVHLLAVFPDDPAVVHQVVETQQLTLEVLPRFELGQVKVQATPTLILVDEQGRVSKVWMGQLPAAEEAEVIAAISKPPAAPSKQQSFLRAPFEAYKPKSRCERSLASSSEVCSQ
jgi:thioredoxin-related protein